MSETPDSAALLSFDWTTFDSPSIAVLTTVAEAADVDPVSLDPLYEAIDPDLLDGIVASTNDRTGFPTVSIGFVYQDYRIRIEANGRGYLYDRDDWLPSATDSQRVDYPRQ